MTPDPIGTAASGATEPSATAPSPYESPELYDLMFESLDFDLAFWAEVGRGAGGPVLDVGCGTGRVLLRLLEAGVDADGVDLFPKMLERLRAKARERGLTARVVLGDMHDFTMPRRYARLISAFNAFAHCETLDDQIRMLRCCREHLEPGGALVLHMSYPSASYWLDPDGEPVLEHESKHPLNGNTIQLWDTRFKNIVGQCQRSRMEFREVTPAGEVVDRHASETTQRWVYRHELELLLRSAGYSRWEVFGGFAREPLERDDQQMVAWAWKD